MTWKGFEAQMRCCINWEPGRTAFRQNWRLSSGTSARGVIFVSCGEEGKKRADEGGRSGSPAYLQEGTQGGGVGSNNAFRCGKVADAARPADDVGAQVV